MQHLRSTMMLNPSPHAWELQLLQQQACPVVPREHFLQLQHQLLQAERINQCLQEELENRTSETNTPQVWSFSNSKRRSPSLILPIWKLHQFKGGDEEPVFCQLHLTCITNPQKCSAVWALVLVFAVLLLSSQLLSWVTRSSGSHASC